MEKLIFAPFGSLPSLRSAAAILALFLVPGLPGPGAAAPAEVHSQAAGLRKAAEAIRQGRPVQDPGEVLSGLESALKAKSDDELLKEAAGLLHFQGRNYGRALGYLKTLRRPGAPAIRALALSYFESKDFRRAAHYFKQMRDITADAGDWEKFCLTLARTGPGEEAVKAFEAFRRSHPESETGLDFLAEHYRQPLQKDKLIPLLELQLKRHAGSLSAKESEILLELARLYGPKHARTAEMLRDYRRLNPNDWMAARDLARTWEESGDIGKALALYSEIAPHFRDDTDFNLHAARLWMRMDPAKALPYYETAGAAAPKDLAVQLEIAALFERLGRKEKALAAYHEALEINPNHAGAKAKVMELAPSGRENRQWLERLVRLEKKNPRDHALQFELSRRHLDLGDTGSAYGYLKKALAGDPGKKEYHAFLPRVVYSDAQVLKHFQSLQKLAAGQSDDARLHYLLARGYFLYKNQARAAQAYARAFALDPGILAGDRQAVLAIHEAKNHTLAGELAHAYLRQDPNDLEIQLVRAEAFGRSGAPAEKLREALQGVIRLDSYHEKWLFRLAELDLAAKDTAAAVEHARNWVRMFPDDKKAYAFLEPIAKKSRDRADLYLSSLENLARLEPEKKAQYELERAFYFFKNKEYGLAAEHLGKLTRHFPDNALLWYRLGRSHEALGRENALDHYVKAYRLEPGNLEYARRIADRIGTDEELKPHLDLLRVVVAKDPNPERRRKLARSLFHHGDYGAAGAQWEWFVKNRHPAALEDALATETFLKLGRWDIARLLLEKRLEKSPKDLRLLTALAEIYRTRDAEKHVALMARILEVNETHQDYLLQMARAQEKSGDRGEALRRYSQWTFHNPDDLDALEAFHRLSEARKDTSHLIEALNLLVRHGKADKKYRFQQAELYYRRGGEISGIEELARTQPDYTEGKLILVREYHSRRDFKRLAGLESFLAGRAGREKHLLEALGDLYVHQDRHDLAAKTYYRLILADKRDRGVYDKVLAHAEKYGSPHKQQLLKIGSESFSGDPSLQAAYAGTLGPTAQALAIYEKVLAKRPKDLEIMGKAIETAKALNKHDIAAKWLHRWAEIDGRNAEPWKQLIAVYGRFGDKGRLAPALEGLYRLQPGDLELTLRLASVHEDLRLPEKALQYYRSAMYLDPADKGLRDKVIHLLKTLRRDGELAQVLQEIQALDTGAHQAQFELAKLYLKKKDKDKAYAYLTMALEKAPGRPDYEALLPQAITGDGQVLKHFDQLERLAANKGFNPDDKRNADLLLHLGAGYFLKKQWEQSGKRFAQAFRLSESRLLENRRAVLAVFGAKNYPLAAELCDRYIEMVPDFDMEIRKIQIIAYEKIGKDPAVVRTALQHLLVVDDDNAGALLRLAELDLKAGDTTAALANIRGCLNTNPTEARGYKMLLPLIENRPNERVGYVVTLEKLIELDPDKRAGYQLRLADFYFERRKYRTTAMLLSEAVKGMPENARAWYRLGYCYAQLGMGGPSLEALRHAYRLEPKNVEYARTYAQTLRSDKELKENLALFEFLARNRPEPQETRQLASSYYLNGDHPKSAEAWDALLSDARQRGTYYPMAAEAYLRTAQYRKSTDMYELRLRKDEAAGLVEIALLDTLSLLYSKTASVAKYVWALEQIVARDAAYKDFQLRLAQAKARDGSAAEAISHYGQWVARNPGDMEALKSLHGLAERQGDTASLESALRYLVRLKGADIGYTFQLAELDFKFTGNTEVLEDLVAKHPVFRRGRLLLCEEYYRRYDLDRLRRFEKFMASEAKGVPWLLGPLAETYAYQEKREKANRAFYDHLVFRKQQGGAEFKQAFEKAWIYGEATGSAHLPDVLRMGHEAYPGDLGVAHAYAASLGKHPEALRLYGDILKANPADVNAMRRGGLLALSLDRTREALPLLEKWSAAAPHEPEAWRNLASAHARLGTRDRQADALDRLVALMPMDGELAFAAARLNRELKREYRALELYVRAHELKPERKEHLTELVEAFEKAAEARLARKDLAEAAGLYEVLLSREPSHSRAALFLGLWLGENKDYASALPLLERGSRALEGQPRDIKAKAWKLTGEGLRARGEQQPALEAFMRAFGADPGDGEVAVAKMELCQELGREKELAGAFADVVRLDSNHLGALEGLGWMRLQEGRYAEAAALYARLTRINAHNADNFALLGHALFETKRRDEALKAYEKAWSLGVRDPAMLDNMARIHHAMGQLALAQAPLEELVVRQPQNHRAGYWLGLIALGKGEFDRAGEMFGAALSYDEGNVEYTEALATVFRRLGDDQIAADLLLPMREKLSPAGRLVFAEALAGIGSEDEAGAQFEWLLKHSPSAAATAGQGQLRLKQKRPEEAKRLLEASPFKKDPSVRLALGQALLALRERDKAGGVFAGLVKEDERNAVFRYHLGKAYLEGRRLEKALEEFRVALKHKPDLSPASYQAGVCLLELGRAEKAREFFHGLTQSFNRTSMAKGFQGLGRASLGEGKADEAREYLRRSLEFSDDPEAMVLLAEASLAMEDIPEAEKWAQRSMEHDPEYPEGMVALAEVLLARGEAEGAGELVREGLAANPRSCELHLEQAKVHLVMGNIQASSASTRYALSLCPEEPMSSFYAGMVADKAYQKEEAQKHFRNFTRLGGDKNALPQGY